MNVAKQLDGLDDTSDDEMSDLSDDKSDNDDDDDDNLPVSDYFIYQKDSFIFTKHLKLF